MRLLELACKYWFQIEHQTGIQHLYLISILHLIDTGYHAWLQVDRHTHTHTEGSVWHYIYSISYNDSLWQDTERLLEVLFFPLDPKKLVDNNIQYRGDRSGGKGGGKEALPPRYIAWGAHYAD